MRTTFLSESRQVLFNLRRSQERRHDANVELSSGLRVTKPSDSPSDAAAVVRTSTDLKVLDQFRTNLDQVQAELRAVDGSLFHAVTVVTRALSLATQGASDTQDATGRAIIASEIDGIFRHLVQLANTNYSGRFLFAGAAVETTPFVIDENSSDGVIYQGDDSSRVVSFPDGRPAQISLPGNAVFARPDLYTGSGRTPEDPRRLRPQSAHRTRHSVLRRRGRCDQYRSGRLFRRFFRPKRAERGRDDLGDIYEQRRCNQPDDHYSTADGRRNHCSNRSPAKHRDRGQYPIGRKSYLQ